MLSTIEMEKINGLVAKMGLEDIKMVNERMSLQRTFLGKDIMRALSTGDKVTFTGRRGITVEGTVMKVKIKNVTVDCGTSGRWNVPASMLKKVA
jgi:methyl coenzyme M reductase subunit D